MMFTKKKDYPGINDYYDNRYFLITREDQKDSEDNRFKACKEKMQYRKNKTGEDISLLGYGCMRFSKKGARIDYEKTEKEILAAIDAGINYFDTAYIYPGSETILGEILDNNNLREKVNIATKLPHYLIRNEKAIDMFFNESCSRLKTDYLDYYLLHMLSDMASWQKLKDLNIEQWIKEKKESGQIRNIGFSFHGDTATFIKLLDVYDWDFCMIQYNYMDENSQAGKAGLQAAYEKGIPVIIMEPLRGGKLVNMLPKDALDAIESSNKQYSPAEWAFRWLFNQKEITCVLSGMNSLDMLYENIRIASETEINSFSEEDTALIDSIKESINKNTLVDCTSCGYCMPCPKGVDIPGTFRCYNEVALENKGTARKEYFQIVGYRKDAKTPDQCIGCGKCESHCPQHLEIIKELKNADKVLRPLPYKTASKVIKKWMYI